VGCRGAREVGGKDRTQRWPLGTRRGRVLLVQWFLDQRKP